MCHYITPEEGAALDCRALAQEIVKTYSVQSEIAQTGSLDALTVMGFVGGNGVAKYSATHKADKRLNQLNALTQEKCSQHPATLAG